MQKDRAGIRQLARNDAVRQNERQVVQVITHFSCSMLRSDLVDCWEASVVLMRVHECRMHRMC